MTLRSEIFEQPAILQRMLHDQREPARRMAAAIRRREPRWAFIAARGSSDNAALYAKYVWGSRNRLAVAMATPSLFTLYATPPRLDGALVVGISQSGRSPDIVSVLAEARRQGALTLAITNQADSPLAAEADLVFDTGTGPELAVAATKTYTAQLLAIAMLSAALDGDERVRLELERVPELVAEGLATDPVVESAAASYREITQCVVLGRGFNYATAYEWSLKLKEMTYVLAEPYSSADFRHGPLAVVDRGFPVLAVAPAGAVFDDVMALLAKLVAERRVDVVALSNEPRALGLARTPLPLPAALPEWLSPLASVVPAQLFCYHLAAARGLDAEAPRGLTKVTETW
jgi:glucosamine--fructose-6-phosphate aminotransferase (isomerizing)